MVESDFFIVACREGNISYVKKCINENFDPSCNGSAAIVHACASGHIDIVKLLMEDNRIDINAYDGRACLLAIENDNILKMLMSDTRFIMTDILAEDENVINMLYQIRQEKLNELIKII